MFLVLIKIKNRNNLGPLDGVDLPTVGHSLNLYPYDGHGLHIMVVLDEGQDLVHNLVVILEVERLGTNLGVVRLSEHHVAIALNVADDILQRQLLGLGLGAVNHKGHGGLQGKGALF